MRAPSGGGLIIYQAYGNLYAMIGRKAHLLEDKQIPSVGVFSTWMAFGGNTRDVGSFGEETDEITDLHQILEEVLLTEHGDSVASIKQPRRDLFSDYSIKQFLNNFANHPNETNMNDLESDGELVETPLVSPFPYSYNDSNDGEVLNELIEYENVGMLRREKAINSFDRDDLAF
ncbi:hypothetical protein Tco_0145852 [Tanacetum coccineum]